MESIKPIELLAPAQNLDFGRAAISHGADAVYMGFTRFGAREAAGNSLSDIEKMVRYAHLFHAKVYVTLNTILFNNELEEVEQLIHKLYNAGADAIIVQDMGILEMNLPPIPLHASTQTHNFDLNRILFLEHAGFERVILARELSIEEIAQIKSRTSVELEAFVHGALCVSFSGQCFMSHALTGRSANRGACAQPCRSWYNLLDENGNILQQRKHLLSLRDLNQSTNMEALLEAGVTSFKIEGRLKDINYVKNVTGHYRQTLDRILLNRPGMKRASTGKSEIEFEPDPNRSFSRGFTTHFAHGRQPNLSTFATQKSIGQAMGKVEEVGKGWFTIHSGHDIANDDGLCFFNKEGQLIGAKVNRIDGTKVYPRSVQDLYVGAQIFRNSNRAFEKQLIRSVEPRRIDCTITLSIGDKGLELRIDDEGGLSSTIWQSIPFDWARDSHKARQSIIGCLSKSGDYPFRVNSVLLNSFGDKVPFLPLSKLNAFRRNLFEVHSQLRIKAHPKRDFHLKPNSYPYPEKQIGFRANVSNVLAEKFYKRHGVQTIEPAFELKDEWIGEEVMVMRFCIMYELGFCNGHERLPGAPKKLFLQDNHHTYPLHFNCSQCQMSLQLPKKLL